MHSLIRSTLLVTLVVLPGSLVVIDEVAAQSTSTLGRVGNEALRQGDYDAAIRKGIRIAKKQATIELLNMPVSAPEAN